MSPNPADTISDRRVRATKLISDACGKLFNDFQPWKDSGHSQDEVQAIVAAASPILARAYDTLDGADPFPVAGQFFIITTSLLLRIEGNGGSAPSNSAKWRQLGERLASQIVTDTNSRQALIPGGRGVVFQQSCIPSSFFRPDRDDMGCDSSNGSEHRSGGHRGPESLTPTSFTNDDLAPSVVRASTGNDDDESHGARSHSLSVVCPPRHSRHMSRFKSRAQNNAMPSEAVRFTSTEPVYSPAALISAESLFTSRPPANSMDVTAPAELLPSSSRNDALAGPGGPCPSNNSSRQVQLVSSASSQLPGGRTDNISIAIATSPKEMHHQFQQHPFTAPSEPRPIAVLTDQELLSLPSLRRLVESQQDAGYHLAFHEFRDLFLKKDIRAVKFILNINKSCMSCGTCSAVDCILLKHSCKCCHCHFGRIKSLPCLQNLAFNICDALDAMHKALLCSKAGISPDLKMTYDMLKEAADNIKACQLDASAIAANHGCNNLQADNLHHELQHIGGNSPTYIMFKEKLAHDARVVLMFLAYHHQKLEKWQLEGSGEMDRRLGHILESFLLRTLRLE